MLPQPVEDHYRSQQRLAAVTVDGARRVWASMTPADFDAAWPQTRRRLNTLISTAQGSAARSGAAYVPVTLAELDVASAPAGTVNTATFAGWTSSGVPLPEALDSTVVRSRQAVSAGASGADALAAGLSHLEGIILTQIADAARGAAGVAIASRPKVGYTRMLNPPSCSRCAVLAGKFFRWNAGFLRHPRCDCRHIPCVESIAGDLTTSPKAYFESLTPQEQAKHFTTAGAEAIRDGADIGQVVNARRGMAKVGSPFTTEGTTRRGFAGRRAAAAGDTFAGSRSSRYQRTTNARLTPESIYEQAADRTEAVALLKRHGYLV